MFEIYNVLVKIIAVCYMVYMVYFCLKLLLGTSVTPGKDRRKFSFVTYLFLAFCVLNLVIKNFLGE